jgi:hypothetical protein
MQPKRSTENSVCLSSSQRSIWPVHSVRGESLFLEGVSARRLVKCEEEFVEVSARFDLELVDRLGEDVQFFVRLYDQNGGLICDEARVRTANGSLLSTQRHTVAYAAGVERHALSLLLREPEVSPGTGEIYVEVVAVDGRGRALVGDVMRAGLEDGVVVVPKKLFQSHVFRSGLCLNEGKLQSLQTAGQREEEVPSVRLSFDNRFTTGAQAVTACLVDELSGGRESLGVKVALSHGEEQGVTVVLPGTSGEWRWVEPEYHETFVLQGWRTLSIQTVSEGGDREELSLPYMTSTRSELCHQRLVSLDGSLSILGGTFEFLPDSQRVVLRVAVQAWGGGEARKVAVVTPRLLGKRGRSLPGQELNGTKVEWNALESSSTVTGDWAHSFQREVSFSWTLPQGAFQTLQSAEVVLSDSEGGIVQTSLFHRNENLCSSENVRWGEGLLRWIFR